MSSKVEQGVHFESGGPGDGIVKVESGEGRRRRQSKSMVGWVRADIAEVGSEAAVDG